MFLKIDDHEQKEVLSILLQGLTHSYTHHTQAAEIEAEVLKQFPEKSRSHSTLAFHIHRKALIKKYLDRIDMKEAELPKQGFLKISSSINRNGIKT
ncbi:MAG: hypothetical protein JXR34_11895 [Bacteroidales bacterium]|nr:hypothetical protein [Bacteroidales bacterium]